VEEYIFDVEYHDQFVKWHNKLKDRKAKTRITARVKRVQKDGDFGDCEFLYGDVWELRLHDGPGYRVYYTRQGDKVVFLLCGGIKSGQKRDIKRAVRLAREVKREKEEQTQKIRPR
jgi:putative addiction module killer protein